MFKRTGQRIVKKFKARHEVQGVNIQSENQKALLSRKPESTMDDKTTTQILDLRGV
jgi:hypothetical protein